MSPYQHWRRRAESNSRRGVILILSTFLVIAGFGMGAFAIDLGWMVLTQAELQNAADSASLAAVLELKAASEGLSQSEIKNNAIQEALLAASFNQAANRDVILDPSQIVLGNRHYDSGDWETLFEGDPGFGDLAYNAVKVDVAFDEASGPRRELELFFARVLGVTETPIFAGSQAHLTPRDMAFLMDISRSMSYDTGDSDGLANVLYPEISDHDREYVAPHWAGGFYQYTWERSVLNLVWGDDINEMLDFAEREFQGAEPYFNYDPSITWEQAQADPNLIAKMFPTRVWLHWKFKAFSDYVYETSGNASAVYDSNKNVVRNRKTDRTMSIVEWCRFLSYNGLVPAVKGQDFYPRASGKFKGNLDTVFPPAGAGLAGAPYPDRVEYYPKPKHVEGFSAAALGTGTGFTGIYPGDVEVQPMAAVRRAALHGIHAMISDENGGNEIFDQVGMITFGAFAHGELELTNKLDLALEVAVSRLTYGPTNRSIPEWTNGYTNIGMPIRQGIDMLKSSPKAREWTQKVMILLSDGEPTISPSGGNTGSEFGGSGTTAAYGAGAATNYAEYWTEEAAEAKIIIHTIAVGTDADDALMTWIANTTGGLSLKVTDPVAQADELKEIFIDLAKDKLGSLF